MGKMTSTELLFCLAAVIASSASQLCLKIVSIQPKSIKSLYVFGAAGTLVLFSILATIWVLRPIHLSQLIPFAACTYILVPLGGHLFLNEHLRVRFWLGVVLIIAGVLFTSL